MCIFITVVAPTDDLATVGAVMQRHGRKATLIDNPSLRTVLQEYERQYLVTTGHCDCDTVLGRKDPKVLAEQRLARERVKLIRKGWSTAKIERSLQEQYQAATRDRARYFYELAKWGAILNGLGDAGLSHAGLFVRMYRGSMSDETFESSRRHVANNIAQRDALATISDSEVVVFDLRMP